MSEEKTMAFVTDFRNKQNAEGLSDPWIEARQGLSPIENGNRVISELIMQPNRFWQHGYGEYL